MGVRPLQQRLASLNDWMGEEVVMFEPYVIDGGASTSDPTPP